MVKNDSKSPGGSSYFYQGIASSDFQQRFRTREVPESAFEFQATKIKTMVGGLAPGLGWLCGQVGFCFFLVT